MHNRMVTLMTTLALISGAAVSLALIQQPPKPEGPEEPEDHETAIAENQVPAEALAALKKLAAGTAITKFAKETEHGHTFYEGSWKGAHGEVDAIVTETGDLTVIEEVVPHEQVPTAARVIFEKVAGKGTATTIEKKSMILYEAHWTADGKNHELVLTPDGRPFVEVSEGAPKEEDDD